MRAQNYLKKPSYLYSKYNFSQTPEMTVKNLMHTSSFDHMIFLCYFEYITISKCSNKKGLEKYCKYASRHSKYNINLQSPFINFIRGVCYYDKRKNDINKKYRVAISVNHYSHVIDEYTNLINYKDYTNIHINSNASFTNGKNSSMSRGIVHNAEMQQMQQKECLNYYSRSYIYNYMCKFKMHKKKMKFTWDGHRKTYKCLKDYINDSPYISSLLITNKYNNNKSYTNTGRVTLFTDVNEFKSSSKKRIKSQDYNNKVKPYICDRSTVLFFFKDLTHVPTFNDELYPNAITIPKKRIAYISDKYPTFRAELLEREYWADASEDENEEKYPYFDFSWCYFNRDDRASIHPSQIIQGHHGLHYTSKIGMYKMLQGLVKYKLVDIEWFFPRSYDLTDKNDLDKFIQFYLANQCLTYVYNVQDKFEAQLKHYGFKLDMNGGDINKLDLNHEQMTNVKKLKFSINKVAFKPAYLIYCLNIVYETLIQNNWNNVDFLTLYKFLIDLNLASEYENLQKLWVYRQYDMLKSSYNTKYDTLMAKIMETNDLEVNTLKRMLYTLEKIKTIGGGGMNRGFNRWIIKPHDLSRGRAITVHSDLGDILDKVANKNLNYIIQKYIEKPLLYKNRKFDIRIWTLLTSSAPVINWVYQKFYIRLSSKKFDINNDDKFVNLTNYAIQKNSNTLNSLNDECMLDYDSFRSWFVTMYSKKEWEMIIRQIYGILGMVSLGGNDQTERRLNVYTVLGWDFMIDSDLNVWLIECNRSPDLNPTTNVTDKLVKSMFKDLANMFSFYNLKDLNNNDTINNVGYFLKLNNRNQSNNISNLFKC